MQRIDEIICDINEKIAEHNGTLKIHGVTRRTVRDKENILYDEKNEQVTITDNYTHTAYHLHLTESYEPLKSGGKNKKSKAVTQIELVCYSEDRNYDDFVKSVLSSFENITIISLNPNGLNIFQRDIGNPKDMNFNIGKYLFSITYRINYEVNFCIDCE